MLLRSLNTLNTRGPCIKYPLQVATPSTPKYLCVNILQDSESTEADSLTLIRQMQEFLFHWAQDHELGVKLPHGSAMAKHLTKMKLLVARASFSTSCRFFIV